MGVCNTQPSVQETLVKNSRKAVPNKIPKYELVIGTSTIKSVEREHKQVSNSPKKTKEYKTNLEPQTITPEVKTSPINN
jgi:hypothetical protein